MSASIGCGGAGLAWLSANAREESRGDVRGDQGISDGGRVDRLGEHGGPGVLEQKHRAPALGAGPQRPVHVLVEVEGGDHDDRQRFCDVRSGELPDGLDRIHPRHADVEQADVWAQRPGEVDRLAAIGGLTDDLDAGGSGSALANAETWAIQLEGVRRVGVAVCLLSITLRLATSCTSCDSRR